MITGLPAHAPDSTNRQLLLAASVTVAWRPSTRASVQAEVMSTDCWRDLCGAGEGLWYLLPGLLLESLTGPCGLEAGPAWGRGWGWPL